MSLKILTVRWSKVSAMDVVNRFKLSLHWTATRKSRWYGIQFERGSCMSRRIKSSSPRRNCCRSYPRFGITRASFMDQLGLHSCNQCPHWLLWKRILWNSESLCFDERNFQRNSKQRKEYQIDLKRKRLEKEENLERWGRCCKEKGCGQEKISVRFASFLCQKAIHVLVRNLNNFLTRHMKDGAAWWKTPLPVTWKLCNTSIFLNWSHLCLVTR